MTTNTAGDEALPQPYFFIDMIEVRKDLMQDFITNMFLLIPVFEGYGWQLISATYTLTGQPSTVIHVWQIPTADSLRDTMVRMGENTTYLKLQETIKSEQQNILSRMPYDPVETAPEAVGGSGPVAPGPIGPPAEEDGGTRGESAPTTKPVEKARVPGDRATEILKKILPHPPK